MKFAWKIFFISFLIIIISFGVGGFLLVNSVFTTSLNNKIQSVRDSNSYITASLYAIVKNAETISNNKNYLKYTAENFADQVAKSSSATKVRIGNINSVSFYDENSFVNKLHYNSRGHKIINRDSKNYIQVVSKIYLIDGSCYIESLENITEIYQSRDAYCRIYQIILIGVAVF